MSKFLRLLTENDKAHALMSVCFLLRQGEWGKCVFDVEPESFKVIPGGAFAYWVSDSVRRVFVTMPFFGRGDRTAQVGGSTKDDFRFLRLWCETEKDEKKWISFAKGGAYSRFYADIYLVVNWKNDASELEAAILKKYPYLGKSANWVLHRESKYFHPGLTWSRRTTTELSLRAMPAGCIFSDKGPTAFVKNDDAEELLALLALTNSRPFGSLVGLQLAAADAAARSYEIGIIQKTPVPELNADQQRQLAEMVRTAWSLKRTLDTTTETSHAFLLPATLRERLGDYDLSAIQAELTRIQTKIDDIAFDLYGFSDADREMAQGGGRGDDGTDGDDEDVERAEEAPPLDSLLSWAVGVAFARFDWRLATGERAAPAEPEPFDPLPAKSPGMLPDDAQPFHRHAGILVDDADHQHDLVRLIEAVLAEVDSPADQDIRRWLRKDFFKYHLQRYSRSRRKAPIYWPIATASGQYTLWVYYRQLTSQTLFTAVNDFVEPKLQEVQADLATLRGTGASRTKAQEKQLEALTDLEAELADLRETLLRIAPGYKPDHDDGVQITAAPLWPVFRHKLWQKVLSDTWEKLEVGDYDWAKLAMAYWPDRVREKCVTDKSLAIAHDLEHLYEEPEKARKKVRKDS